jgi:HSP20 family protein
MPIPPEHKASGGKLQRVNLQLQEGNSMSIKDLVPKIWTDNGELTRYGMGRSLFDLQKEMNDLFEHFSRSMFKPMERMGEDRGMGALMPKLDMSETDNELEISAELPGLDEKDIDVSLTRNVLTIKGEKKMEKEEKKKDFYRKERSYGSFKRSIPLPTDVDTNKVEAKFKKGVLTIRLPKVGVAKKEAKKIAIKTE